jgi:hypothetical protein
MAETSHTLATIFAACWKDEGLKARFMSEPKTLLAEYGIDVSDGIEVTIVENSDNCVHITLPLPPSGHLDLSDEQLRSAAGGIDPYKDVESLME